MRFFRLLSLLASYLILIFNDTFSADQLDITAGNTIKGMVDLSIKGEPKQYVQDWTDITIRYKWFEFALGYEAHLPPTPSSYYAKGQGMKHRSFIFSKDALHLTAGTSYALLGNGLTLNLYENRDLTWDTNLDGVQLNYANDAFDVTLLGGSPQDPSGQRHQPLIAAETNIAVLEIIHPGFSFVATDSSGQHVFWGSLFSQLYLPFANIKAEFAMKDVNRSGAELDKFFSDFTAASRYGKALYFSATWFIGPFSLISEAKYYDSFSLQNGLTYNNPPSVIKEHTSLLQNDRQPQTTADDERGMLVDFSGPVGDFALITMGYCNTRRLDNSLLYHNLFAQGEVTLTENIRAIIGAGMQEDIDGRYWSGVGHGTITLSDTYSIGFEFEHQHATINNNTYKDRKFFTQAYSANLIRSPNFSLSAIGAHTSDPDYKKSKSKLLTKGWFGMQVDFMLLEMHNFSVFAGSRKSGKTCAGGACVTKPELHGIEVALTSRF